MPVFQKTYTVTITIDPSVKAARSEIQEHGGRIYTIEYIGDGKEYHGILQNNLLVTNLESWKEVLQHVLKYSSKVIFTRFGDFTRNLHYRSRVEQLEEEDDVA